MARHQESRRVSDLSPLDPDHNWQEIYRRLASAIGEADCYAWFGHCKFIRRDWGRLELQTWCGFVADEGLRRHGYELARIAGVTEVRVYRSGGYVPVGVNEPARRNGWAAYRAKGHQEDGPRSGSA
jgi:hypothetical protein